MGVQGIIVIINQYGEGCTTEHDFSEFDGEKMGLDAYQQLYKFKFSSNGGQKSHIVGAFLKTYTMLKHGMLPIWVFDGPPPKLKRSTLNKRKYKKNNARHKLEQSDLEFNEKINLEKKAFSITSEMIVEVKTLLDNMGIPYIQAGSEAEAYCALINRHKYVDAVVTDDWDAILFGASMMIKNFTKQTRVKKINIKKLLEILGLSLDQFIDLCLLMGTDYCQGIKGIKPNNMYEIFKKANCNVYDVLELLIKNNIKCDIPHNYIDQYKLAKNYYKEQYNQSEISLIPFSWKTPNIPLLKLQLLSVMTISQLTMPLEKLLYMYDQYKMLGKVVALKIQPSTKTQLPTYSIINDCICNNGLTPNYRLLTVY